METDIKQNSKRILESSREALDYSIKRKKEVASGGNKEDLIDYDRKIEFHLLKIKDNLTEVYSEIKQTPTVEGAKQLTKQPGVSGQAFNTKLSFTLRKSFLNDLNLTPEDLKKFIKNQEKSKTPEEEKGYTTYKSNAYAKISNAVVERITASVIKSHKDQFKSLFSALNSANMKIFSRSYIDMMVFSAFLAFPVFTVLAFIILNKILLSLLLGVLAMPLTFLMMYGYPFSVVNSRKRQIKRELVFAIIHMSAVAGSGAEPSKIFKLLIKSKEYNSGSIFKTFILESPKSDFNKGVISPEYNPVSIFFQTKVECKESGSLNFFSKPPLLETLETLTLFPSLRTLSL